MKVNKIRIMTVQTAVSPETYLEFEYQSKARHEYINGKIIRRAYSSEAHSLIISNLIYLLSTQFLESGSRVYPVGRLLHVEAANRYYYPDVMVVTGRSQLKTYKGKMKATLNPSVLIEVLSDSTAKADTIHKWQAYKKIPTLKEYFLITQDVMAVQKFTLDDKTNNWLVTDYSLENSTIPVLNKELDIADIYYNVDFPEGDSTADD